MDDFNKEVPIPRDLRAYKTKNFGPFTTREAICVAIIAIICIILWNFLDWAPRDVKFIILAIFCGPIALIGFKEFYGVPAEKFFITMFTNEYLCPPKLLYKTKNEFYPENFTFRKTPTNAKLVKSKNPKLKAYK